jgi:hypothetical protein
MDWLMVFVILAIVGQFVVIKFLQMKQAKIAAFDRSKARADLLEAAADRQIVSTSSQNSKISAQEKGACDA